MMLPKLLSSASFRNSMSHWNDFQRNIVSLKIVQCDISFKLQLHDAIYRLRFYSNSLIHILSLLNWYNNVASIQKNRGDKSHHVIVALASQVLWLSIIISLIMKKVATHACGLLSRKKLNAEVSIFLFCKLL